MRHVMYDDDGEVLGYWDASGIAEAFAKADEVKMPAVVAARATDPMTWTQMVSVLWAVVPGVRNQAEAHRLAVALENDNFLISGDGDWYLVMPAADVIARMLRGIRHPKEVA